MEKPRAGIEGVNSWMSLYPYPLQQHRVVEDGRFEQREVLLVDHRNRPILVRQPRPVGFRPRGA